jgi:hypothetical protein
LGAHITLTPESQVKVLDRLKASSSILINCIKLIIGLAELRKIALGPEFSKKIDTIIGNTDIPHRVRISKKCPHKKLKNLE